jgi:hypothetical protein
MNKIILIIVTLILINVAYFLSPFNVIFLLNVVNMLSLILLMGVNLFLLRNLIKTYLEETMTEPELTLLEFDEEN